MYKFITWATGTRQICLNMKLDTKKTRVSEFETDKITPQRFGYHKLWVKNKNGFFSSLHFIWFLIFFKTFFCRRNSQFRRKNDKKKTTFIQLNSYRENWSEEYFIYKNDSYFYHNFALLLFSFAISYKFQNKNFVNTHIKTMKNDKI